MRRALTAAVLVACGGGGAAKNPTTLGAKAGGSQAQLTALRERVKVFCGKAYAESLDDTKGEGCPFTSVDKWRGAMELQTDKDVPTHVRVELSGPAADAAAMRARALELVSGLLDDAETAEVNKALTRVFGSTFISDMVGHLGPLSVIAGTTFDPAVPDVRGVVLDLDTHGEGGARPLADVTATQFASPAKEVHAEWVTAAKAACTELANFVSKTHQIDAVEPKWSEGDLFVSCVHANENAVAQFVASWAPGTKRLLYFRVVAEVPQKKFAALVDKLIVPLLNSEQTKVAKVAAKKEPLDRKFEAQGLQMGSRHDSGGFYGETHELEVSVQVGYGREGSNTE